MPIIGDTQEDAERILAELGDLVQPDIALAALSGLLLGADLSGLDLDRPVPADRLIDPSEAATHPSPVASRYPALYRIVVDEKPTLREPLRTDRKSTRLNSSHSSPTRLPSSALKKT